MLIYLYIPCLRKKKPCRAAGMLNKKMKTLPAPFCEVCGNRIRRATWLGSDDPKNGSDDPYSCATAPDFNSFFMIVTGFAFKLPIRGISIPNTIPENFKDLLTVKL